MPPITQNPTTVSPTPIPSQGGRLVSVDGRILPLRDVSLESRAAGGLAHTRVLQTFSNPHDEPLNVTYAFPLPAGGAVGGYEFRIGERVVRGEIDRREKARERYEQALLEGHTAALVDQDRANLFTQEIGNVAPGAEIEVELQVDHPLHWLDDGKWEWRFPTVIAPRYLGDTTRMPDAGRVSVDVAQGEGGVRAGFSIRIDDELIGGVAESPSHHVIDTDRTVSPRNGKTRLDRDIVVRWPVAGPVPGVSLRRARPAEGAAHAGSAYGILTVVPPVVPGATMARDLIVLLDVSGSMMGAQLDHAKSAVLDLIESLTDDDRLQIVAFASSPVHWRKEATAADATARKEAASWVRGLKASGGTNMVTAIEDALKPLRREAQRQVVLVSDGLIGFEKRVLQAIAKRLPDGSRLHAVGVGSASNQGFLHAAARAGRGAEVLIGVGENPDVGGRRIVAATRAPVVTGFVIEGSAVEAFAPRRPADLMAASPLRVGLRLKPEGGELVVRGRTAEGGWQQRIQVEPTGFDDGDAALTRLYGRESVEDLELELAGGGSRDEIDRQIERIGLEFGIATRLTSWIAVDERPSVDPRSPVRVERIPQELPFGMSAEGLGFGGADEGLGLFREASMQRAAFDFCPAQPAKAKRIRDLEATEPGHLEQLMRKVGRPFGRLFSSGDGLDLDLVFTGRLMRSSRPDTCVVQFETRDSLDWPEFDKVRAQIDDTWIKVEVVQERTTAPGTIPGQSLVRLELRIPAEELERARLIHINAERSQLLINLEGA